MASVQDIEARLRQVEDKLDWFLSQTVFQQADGPVRRRITALELYREEKQRELEAMAEELARKHAAASRVPAGPEPDAGNAGDDSADAGGEEETFEQLRARLLAGG